MSDALVRLADSDLRTLATALRSGRLALPLTPIALLRLLSSQRVDDAARGIEGLAALGLAAPQIAAVLELLVRDRAGRGLPEGIVDLVTTGPDGVGANRDTGVVVRELFANATQSVLVAGYAVYQGQSVFQALADRMLRLPSLQVSMYLDIQRGPGDTTAASDLVRRFLDRFKKRQWPADHPIPDLYYHPRSLDPTMEKRSCLHAKCVVIDGEKVFVSSANFTEAAQLRNIEVGVLINSRATANQITSFFRSMVNDGHLSPIR